MKMGIKLKKWGMSKREEGQDWSKFCFGSKDTVGGSNGHNEKFGDEEESMLWFDGKGVANFKKSSTGVAEDT